MSMKEYLKKFHGISLVKNLKESLRKFSEESMPQPLNGQSLEEYLDKQMD